MPPYRRAALFLALTVCVLAPGCSKNKASGEGDRENRQREEDSPPADEQTEPPLDTSCESDEECVPAPSCCPEPCTEHVINRGALDEARARLRERCPTQPDDCPVAGACMEHAYLCVEGTCELVYHDDPEFERRED